MLSRRELIKRIRSDGLITPEPSDTAIDQVSVDLTLGRKFTKFKEPPEPIASVYVGSGLWAKEYTDDFEGDEFTIGPNEFVLAHTMEIVRVPPDLVGMLQGRSSWARCGLLVHLTAPKIDPGFNATITLEIVNFNKHAFTLRAGHDTPAQIMFQKLSSPIREDNLYGSRFGDMFQGQDAPLPLMGMIKGRKK